MFVVSHIAYTVLTYLEAGHNYMLCNYIVVGSLKIIENNRAIIIRFIFALISVKTYIT